MGEDYLKHYGVKGMKWGVRKSDDGSTRAERKQTKKTEKADRKFEKQANSNKVFYDVYNKAAKSANAKMDAINNSAKYKGKDLRKDPKLMAQYNREVQTMFNKSLTEAANSMGNASGTKRYGVQFDNNGNWSVKSENVKHADEEDLYVVPEYDDLGHILSFEFTTEKPELKHYGVKGMKWGVRKSDPGSGGSSGGDAPSRKQAKRVAPTTKRSSRAEVSDDVQKVVKSMGKINRSGTASLTNDELRDVINRMNLERQYSSLMRPDPNVKSALDRGHEHVKKTVGIGKTIEEARKFLDTPTGQAVKTGLVGAATAAAAYSTGGASAAATAGAGAVIRRVAANRDNR